jgi:hypothetical protein
MPTVMALPLVPLAPLILLLLPAQESEHYQLDCLPHGAASAMLACYPGPLLHFASLDSWL